MFSFMDARGWMKFWFDVASHFILGAWAFYQMNPDKGWAPAVVAGTATGLAAGRLFLDQTVRTAGGVVLSEVAGTLDHAQDAVGQVVGRAGAQAQGLVAGAAGRVGDRLGP
jgi:hypothetical protein